MLWQLSGGRTLAADAQEAIEGASELSFSVVSFAEIGIKAAAGKLNVPGRLYEQILESGLQLLGLSPEHGLAVARLPLHHRDPFDRLLISQARCEGLSVVTADRRFDDYDVCVVAA